MKSVIPIIVLLVSLFILDACVREVSCRVKSLTSWHESSGFFNGRIMLVVGGLEIVNRQFGKLQSKSDSLLIGKRKHLNSDHCLMVWGNFDFPKFDSWVEVKTDKELRKSVAEGHWHK